MGANGSAVRPKPQEHLGSATIEERRTLRVDPIAHAWRVCNPNAPLPRLLGRALEGAAVFYAEKRILDADTSVEKELSK